MKVEGAAARAHSRLHLPLTAIAIAASFGLQLHHLAFGRSWVNIHKDRFTASIYHISA